MSLFPEISSQFYRISALYDSISQDFCIDIAVLQNSACLSEFSVIHSTDIACLCFRVEVMY